MRSDEKVPASHPARQRVLAGLWLWLAAFALYLLPGFVVAFRLAFNLGPTGRSSGEVGTVIGQAVGELYRTHATLHYGYVLVLAALIFWRVHVLTRRGSVRPIVDGVLVACVPLMGTVVPWLLGGHIRMSAMATAVIVAAGVGGGRSVTPPAT